MSIEGSRAGRLALQRDLVAAEETETWRPVAGYEGCYEVSDRLRVRSLPRTVARGRGVLRVGERVLAAAVQHRHGRQYLQVALSVGGRPKRFYAHRLAAEAFGDASDDDQI